MEAVFFTIFFFKFPLDKKNIDMSTKTLEWDCKKLGSGWDLVNSFPTLSQPADYWTLIFPVNKVKIKYLLSIYIILLVKFSIHLSWVSVSYFEFIA